MTSLIPLLLVGMMATPARAAEPPKVEECLLVTPMIRVGDKTAAAGAGFLVTDGDRTLLLTSHQVVGPAGGLKQQVGAKELHEGFVRVVAHDAFDSKKECARADKVLGIEAAPMGDTSAAADVAAFVLVEKKSAMDSVGKSQGTMHAAKLASAMPKVDDPVFLVAKTAGEARVIEGKVGQITDGFLFYEFTGTPELVGTVGGPVLNGAGEVVGIHVGMGTFEDGTVFGSANPMPAVKKALAAKAIAGTEPE
jgi:hypothetical protein